MAIPATAKITEATFDLGIGKLTFAVEDDAGTLRVVARYNGARVEDWTPAGGHVEKRQLDTPDGYQRV